MEQETLVKRTAIASLLIQCLAGIATIATFFVPDPQDYEFSEDIKIIAGIEGASQLVELLYYFIAVVYFKGAISTWTRYIDWYISTPIMLLSTSMFFVHRYGGDIMSVLDIRTSPYMYTAFSLNALMLSFGLSRELGTVSTVIGVGLGTLAFTASFSYMGRYVDDTDRLSVLVFWCIFVLWLLYGVAALFSYTFRNVSYNILDVFSKNVYGVFLLVYFLTR